MTDLKEWVGRNAHRPLAYAISTVLCVHVGYLAYLAHDEYSAQLRRIDRVVQTASLGIQQDNRSLIESALLMGLHNSDAAQVALCRGGAADLIYPPSAADPCRAAGKGLLRWTIRRKAVGMAAYDFVFVINGFDAFAPLAILLLVTLFLGLSVAWVLVRARRRFEAEILDPLRLGLNDERVLEISELDDLRRKNQEYNALSRRQAVSEALVDLSAQVAHDIRSPLAALEVVSGDAAQLPEARRIMIRSAVGRIRDIANSLLSQHQASSEAVPASGEPSAAEPISSQLLSGLIDSVVTEKRLQFRSISAISIDASRDVPSYGLFALVLPIEFKRALSNLINNAVEALDGSPGSVRVNLRAVNGEVLVAVQDDGKGIPPEIIEKLGRRGETFGKAGGSGLGLHHARASAEALGGRLEIASQHSKGTTVTVSLPQAPAPDWFVSELVLSPGSIVAILDDDESIHRIWQERLAALASPKAVEIVHFSTPRQLRDWIKGRASHDRKTLYLLDYELLGHAETGLSLVEELGISASAILVTSRHEEPRVLDGCRKLGMRMIPKGLAGLVPIRFEEFGPADGDLSGKLDAVLIDDDRLTRMLWKDESAKHGKRLRAFPTVADFLTESDRIEKSTPVYVDAKLAGGVNGANESLRIHELGFTEIYLATGYAREKFGQPAHLRGVIGKEPPWP